jgi:hypothetical protein
MSLGAARKKNRRVVALEAELSHLESLPEVRIKTGPKHKTMPHTARQFRRMEFLRTDAIPQARRRVSKS